MFSRYNLLLDKGIKLASRETLVERAWGKDIPISFIQDCEYLDDSSYLDLKVNKWEMNKKWSNVQKEEPWIRVEILRDNLLADFLDENNLNVAIDHSSQYLITFGLDDEWLNIDLILLAYFIKAFSDSHQCHICSLDCEHIIEREYFESLPSKALMIKILKKGDVGIKS